MKRHSNKGFTVMEMLIVIAVIAILIAIAIPTFNSALKKVKAATCAANRRAMLAEIKLEQMLDEDLLYEGKENEVFSAHWDKCAKECTCPDGGVFTAKYDDKGFIKSVECSKHSANLGDKGTMNSIYDVLNTINSKTIDSGAAGIGNGHTDNALSGFAAAGIDLKSLGAKSWQYNKDSKMLYWSESDISTMAVKTQTPVIRYNQKTGTYTVWIATISSKTLVDEPYNIFTNYNEYKPSTGDTEHQTYEDALKYYQQASKEYSGK